MSTWIVDAVLFDLDGTLVDSSGSVERSWRQLADLIGRPWAEVEPRIHGTPVPQVLADIAPELGPERVAELQRFMIDAESTDVDGVVPQPGAVAALRDLPQDRMAIVTSGTVRLSSARIAAAGLPRPGTVVTADDVTLGKPDPALFRLGAQRLGFAPERCLAVEDAPAGVISARTAGCTVIGVLTTHTALDAPTVPSFDRISFRPIDGGAGGIEVSIPD